MCLVTAIERYCKSFWGWGELENAKCWFVGLEPGLDADGDAAVEELKKRIKCWECLRADGDGATLDLHAEHECWGETRWFGDNPQRQNTFIRLAELAKGFTGAEEDALEIQAKVLGRRTRGEKWPNALLELMPVPAKRLSAWPMGDLISHQEDAPAWLQTRQAYEQELRGTRVDAMKGMIGKYKPECVVFYGQKAQRENDFARNVVRSELVVDGGKDLNASYHRTEFGSTLVFAPHPVPAFGNFTDEQWRTLGEELSRLVEAEDRAVERN